MTSKSKLTGQFSEKEKILMKKNRSNNKSKHEKQIHLVPKYLSHYYSQNKVFEMTTSELQSQNFMGQFARETK